ncbi:hypothetical protein LLB_1104 [Legionella longbeachae D-4968]|nr:hypothetical protein LLB_1104 [Legionella longbeachae D-4968]
MYVIHKLNQLAETLSLSWLFYVFIFVNQNIKIEQLSHRREGKRHHMTPVTP